MRNIFTDFCQLISFIQLSREEKRVIFYSEDKNTWIHLKGVISELIRIYDVDICYISSDKDDPGLNLVDSKYKAFKIRQGHILNWLFANIDADVFVMTTPDLNCFQLKRSKYNVHYIYMQHSLISLHMAYREKAFTYFDTIFCAGPHHVAEMENIIQIQKLKPKNIVMHGYSRYDQIVKETINKKNTKENEKIGKHVLIAPSWGDGCIIETIGSKLVEILLEKKFKVTLRPHPQTLRLNKMLINKIVAENNGNFLFNLDDDISHNKSFQESDLMISDWSGAALDYAFGLNKPILYIDVDRKINNQEYDKIGIVPIEVKIREKIGIVISKDKLNEIPTIINSLLQEEDKRDNETLKQEVIFNTGNSDTVGAQRIYELVNDINGI